MIDFQWNVRTQCSILRNHQMSQYCMLFFFSFCMCELRWCCADALLIWCGRFYLRVSVSLRICRTRHRRNTYARKLYEYRRALVEWTDARMCVSALTVCMCACVCVSAACASTLDLYVMSKHIIWIDKHLGSCLWHCITVVYLGVQCACVWLCLRLLTEHIFGSIMC